MERKPEDIIKISVRNLVEFIFRSGDIDNRRTSIADKDAMQEGGRIHRKIQKSMGGDYQAEVTLKECIDFRQYAVSVEGRADGIFTEDKTIYIDEIKGIYLELAMLDSPFYVHKAQAMCYAYIYAKQKQMKNIGIQMTYANLETEDIRRFREIISWEELEKWFSRLLQEYKKWTDYQFKMRKKRNTSIKQIEFPFTYRVGQRELAVSVYRTIQRKKTLFIQAPTGIGKTISAVFPAIKAVGEGLGERIFYLTAKTMTRAVAEEAFYLLTQQGLCFKTVTITAKDKLCLCDERECNPAACSYAAGHYDRVNLAVYDLLQSESSINREIIIQYAKQYKVCPFEMCLDTSNWVDGIICDYNYVFDPNVKLKRYFGEGISGEYIFLIDEAHNLPDRAREMFSASIIKEDFLEMKKLLEHSSRQLTKDLQNINKIMLLFKRECEEYEILTDIGTLYLNLVKLIGDLDKFMEEHPNFSEKKRLLEFYFQIRSFVMIYESVDENYQIYSEYREDKSFLIRLFCIDTAKNISKCLEKGISTIFFSATLLPIQYYKGLLSNHSDDYAIYADSPFDIKKRLLLSAIDVTSRYTRRTQSQFERIFQYIWLLSQSKIGNYMIFFPSYYLMKQIYNIAEEKGNKEQAELIIQKNTMTEKEREEFLDKFKNREQTRSLVAFCILGGIFSEGIDLAGKQLIGAAIVGTGLPQICTEKKILQEYYEQTGKNGFDYAYRYPGMNKVQQAAGRVIRTMEDEGVILLMDERFQEAENIQLFPREWADCKRVTLKTLESKISAFWSQRNKTEK